MSGNTALGYAYTHFPVSHLPQDAPTKNTREKQKGKIPLVASRFASGRLLNPPSPSHFLFPLFSPFFSAPKMFAPFPYHGDFRHLEQKRKRGGRRCAVYHCHTQINLDQKAGCMMQDDLAETNFTFSSSFWPRAACLPASKLTLLTSML